MRRALVALALCLAALLGAVGWITATTLRLDAAEARARRQAALEEAVRLALWRLDSDLAPILAREATRPYFHYLARYPAGRPFGQMFDPPTAGEPLVRSPLDAVQFRDVVVYFQIDPSGAVSSPQHAADLSTLRPLLDRNALLGALGAPPPRWTALTHDLPRQQAQSAAEYQQRTKSVQQIANAANFDAPGTPAEDPGGLRPLWRGDRLILVRMVTVSGDTYMQGLELAWPVLREDLLRDVRDILPEARLEPAGVDAPAERRLASLPVRLDPGRLAAVIPDGGVATTPVLVTAWAAVLVACATVVALVLGALALGERRAAFVSAVTHELRTPLTTLRTYTEMLEGDMVPVEKRPGYLRTLAREAERLARLVDNVLAYARLERGRRPQIEVTTTAALVERARPLLEERAAAAGVAIAIEAEDAEPVRADPAAVEQILFNLVENACKYGGGTPISVVAHGASVSVRDGGPGIAAADRRWLFQPFARSAERAAGSAPGVGLGLALCRRLARAMGGDLTLEPGAGAGFALKLRG